MPIFTNFRSSMAAGGGGSTSAEETLITWSGTNGESTDTSVSDFTSYSTANASGNSGFFQLIGDNKGHLAGTGNDTNSSLGINMVYSGDAGATWTTFFKQTYDKSGGSLNDWEYPQYGTVIDGLFFFVARRCILVGDPANDLSVASNWDFGDAGGTTNFYRQIYEAQIDGTRYIIMNGNDGSRRYTTIASGKDYTDNSNWTTETGTTSEDWTSQLVLPRASGGTTGDNTVLLLNAEHGYFYDWTSNGGEPFDVTISQGNTLTTKNPQWNYKRADGFWVHGHNNKLHYMDGGTTPAVSDYDGWTEVNLGSISGYSSDFIGDFITAQDSQTVGIAANNFVAFAKNPKNLGGSDGWYIIDTFSAGLGNNMTMTYSDGYFWISSGSDASTRTVKRTRGWMGDEVTVTFDTALCANPIKYVNQPGVSSAATNDMTLYEALHNAIDAGKLTGVTVTYNGGSNNGTGVKIVNDEEESYANITITGASSTATINTYVDN